MEFDFTGKVCLVTGGGSGIGARIGIRLAGSGAQLVLTDINEENVKKVSEECDKVSPIGLKALPFVADITRYEDNEKLVDTTIGTFHKLDVLVNCAGIFSMTSITEPNYMDEYRRVLSTNTTSAVSLSHLSAAHLAKTNGNIVNISSIFSTEARRATSAYCMSKSCMTMLTKTLADELGKLGVRVNCVSPSIIVTPIFQTTFPKDIVDRIIDFYAGIIPIGRCGQPDDIASAVLYLASDQSGFVTGTDLWVNGGGFCGCHDDLASVLAN